MVSRKGWLRILEVVIAAMLFFGFVSLLQGITGVRPDIYEQTAELGLQAEQALLTLDSIPDGGSTFLRQRLKHKEYSSLNSKTREILPEGFRFSYDVGSNHASLPSDATTASRTYLVNLGNGNTEAVCLYIWRRG